MRQRKIIFKIGGDMMEDIRKDFQNPSLIKESTHTVYLKSVDDIPKILTPERLRMLVELSEDDSLCPDVKTLTKKLRRPQESVSRDLTALETNGLVTKTKKGKNVYPKLNAKEIVIQLA